MTNGEARELFNKFARELRDLAWEVHERREGGETPEQLLELFEGMLEAIEDRVDQQRRMIHYLQGKPVAPQVHQLRAVVTGQGGGAL